LPTSAQNLPQQPSLGVHSTTRFMHTCADVLVQAMIIIIMRSVRSERTMRLVIMRSVLRDRDVGIRSSGF